MRHRSGISLAGVVITLVVAVALAAALWAVYGSDLTGRGGSGLDGRFNYDLSVVRKTDPDLVRYEEITPAIEAGMEDPRAIALDAAGRIFVAGGTGTGTEGVIRVREADGRLIRDLKTRDIPRCLALAGAEALYVGMKDHVEVIALDGQVKASWTSLGPSAVLTSIAAAGSDVFVADAGNRVVLHYDGNGKLLGRIDGKAGEGKQAGFVVPSPYFDLAIAPDGLLRVAHPGRHRIETYGLDGQFKSAWGRFGADIKGFCGCCNPVNFAILADGRFVTAEKGLPRVKVYDPAGQFECVVVGADSFPVEYACINKGADACAGGAMDLAADASGRVYVLEPHQKLVLVYVKNSK